MNHPTEQVDELVLLSQQAIACDDYDQAGLFLRRAIELAPLRKDLRAELARVLTHASAESTPYQPSHNESASATDWRNTPPGSRVQSISGPRPRLQPLPSTALATAMRGPIGSTSVTPSSRTSTPAQVSVRTEGNVNLRLDEEPMSFSDFADDMEYPDEGRRTPLHTLLEDDEEPALVPIPAPAPRRRRGRSKLIQQRSSIEDLIAGGYERGLNAVRQANPAKVGYAICYVALAIFVGSACIQSRRVFGDQQKRVELVKAKPEAIPVVEHASMEVPSLFSTVGPTLPLKTEEDILSEGRKLLEAKDFTRAIACLEPSLSANTRTASHDLIRQTLAKAYDAQGTVLVQKASFKDAAGLYRKAVNVSPGLATFQLHLSNALYYQATASSPVDKVTLQEAAKLASNVILVEPKNGNAYVALAQAQEAMGKKADAKSAWQRVVTLTSKTSAANKRALEHLQSSKGA